eukprot:gene2850-5687_t
MSSSPHSIAPQSDFDRSNKAHRSGGSGQGYAANANCSNCGLDCDEEMTSPRDATANICLATRITNDYAEWFFKDLSLITSTIADSIAAAAPPHHGLIAAQIKQKLFINSGRIPFRLKFHEIVSYLREVIQDICLNPRTAILHACEQKTQSPSDGIYSLFDTALVGAFQRVRSLAHHVQNLNRDEASALSYDLSIIIGVCNAISNVQAVEEGLSNHLRDLFLTNEFVQQLSYLTRELTAHPLKTGRAHTVRMFSAVLNALHKIFDFPQTQSRKIPVTHNFNDERAKQMFSLGLMWHEDSSKRLFQDQSEKEPRQTDALERDPVFVILRVATLVKLLALCAQEEIDIMPHTVKWSVLLSEGTGLHMFLPIYSAYANALCTIALRFSSQRSNIIDALWRSLTGVGPLISFQVMTLKEGDHSQTIKELQATIMDCCVRVVQAMNEDQSGALAGFVSSINLSVQDQDTIVRDVIVENSVLLLTELATRLQEETDSNLMGLIVTMLYQRLGFPPSRIDTIIIQQLGRLAIAGSLTIYESVMEMMFQLYLKGSLPKHNLGGTSQSTSQLTDFDEHIVPLTLCDMARHTMLHKKGAVFLEKILGLFNRLATTCINNGLNIARTAKDLFIPLLPAVAAFTKSLIAPLDIQQRRTLFSSSLIDNFR